MYLFIYLFIFIDLRRAGIDLSTIIKFFGKLNITKTFEYNMIIKLQ